MVFIIAGLVLVAIATCVNLLLTAGLISRLREVHRAMIDWTERVAVNSLLSGLREGERIPPFTAVTVDGERLVRDDLTGDGWLVGFFAGACGSCRTELPRMGDVIHDLGVGARALIVIDGTAKQAADLITQAAGIGRVILEPDAGELSSAFKVKFFPTFFVLNSQREIAFGSNSIGDVRRHVIA